MCDDHKYNWDEMIRRLFHINEHRINNTGWMMKWWWNGGVERKAKLLLRECWTFLTYIFLHQQWKQCLEFALAKLREKSFCMFSPLHHRRPTTERRSIVWEIKMKRFLNFNYATMKFLIFHKFCSFWSFGVYGPSSSSWSVHPVFVHQEDGMFGREWLRVQRLASR